MQRERVSDIGLDADVIDHRGVAGSDIGAELPAAPPDQRKPDAATDQASNGIRATLHCAPASASATATGLHGIAPGRHAERQAIPATARGSRAALMAGKSYARCNALQRNATHRNATQRDGSYCATQDDTAASSTIRTAWASALAGSKHAARQTGASVEPLPTTPEFQGVLHASPAAFADCTQEKAMQNAGEWVGPAGLLNFEAIPTLLRRRRPHAEKARCGDPAYGGTARGRHDAPPPRNNAIDGQAQGDLKSGKRKKRPVVRYSTVPWHGIAAMRNVPQHRAKRVRQAVGGQSRITMPRIVYESWRIRVRIVVGTMNE